MRVGIDLARRLNLGHERRDQLFARLLGERHVLKVRDLKRMLCLLFRDFVDF